MDRNTRVPRINAIATAVPASDYHQSYIEWALNQVDPGKAGLLRRMLQRSGIAHRFSVLADDDTQLVPGSFYAGEAEPTTAQRMAVYAREAPELALTAAERLGCVREATHLVVASCTGFMAPGIDQIIARRLGLSSDVERILIGFMGCYAGITALRTAAHLVRSDPDARVLVITVELCSLHLQRTGSIESLLAMAQFADGATAAMVTGTGEGLALGSGISLALEESEHLIGWTIGDNGFVMELSGEVPSRLAAALADPAVAQVIAGDHGRAPTDAWAVHPGGRSVLDAVERALAIAPGRLESSRSVLADTGNMSSATVLFVLERLMAERPERGVALAFGPGLAVEGLRFGWLSDAG